MSWWMSVLLWEATETHVPAEPEIKKTQCRTFPFTYANPSRQATSPSTAQLTGMILNDVSV